MSLLANHIQADDFGTLHKALGRQEIQAAADHQAVQAVVDRTRSTQHPACFAHWRVVRSYS